MTFEIRKVGIIGAGQMGNGIAQVCALAGLDVLLNDVAEDRIKPIGAIHAGGEIVVGQQGVGRLLLEVRQRLDLVCQHVKDEACILFGIVDMAGLKAAVMVVLDEVVLGVSRKG